MNALLLPFNQLTPTQLYDILALRQDVFILEQNCLYNDLDGHDKTTMHLLYYEDDTLIAYLRIFHPNTENKYSSLGRIVVSKEHRGKGIGRKLILEGIDHISKNFPNSLLKIEAQFDLLNYYQSLGFVTDGMPYIEFNIKHIRMLFKETL